MRGMEEWRDIKGYEGLYQVSNLGNIKSLKDNYGRPRIKILKLKKRKDGYMQINLLKNHSLREILIQISTH